MELCREIRQVSNIPIIMITARVEEIDRRLPDQEIISTVYGIGYKFSVSSD